MAVSLEPEVYACLYGVQLQVFRCQAWGCGIRYGWSGEVGVGVFRLNGGVFGDCIFQTGADGPTRAVSGDEARRGKAAGQEGRRRSAIGKTADAAKAGPASTPESGMSATAPSTNRVGSRNQPERHQERRGQWKGSQRPEALQERVRSPQRQLSRRHQRKSRSSR